MKALNNLLILTFLIPLFTYCQRSLMPDWHKEVIVNFIQKQLESPTSYQGGQFKIIDQEYLESQPVIADCMSALNDYYLEILNETGSKNQLPVLKLDTLNTYLSYLPELYKSREKETVVELQFAIKNELEFLDDILHEFNLSIYHPLPVDSLIVYHEYSAKTTFGEFAIQSIFEIDNADKIILAEKILHKTHIL